MHWQLRFTWIPKYPVTCFSIRDVWFNGNPLLSISQRWFLGLEGCHVTLGFISQSWTIRIHSHHDICRNAGNGYTSLAKFHYLHHDEKGRRYANLSELGERSISAAKTAIRITLISISYKEGGFGIPTEVHQRILLRKMLMTIFT